ncbi:MAG TPA: type II toxin-antitoxin system PemK/MazF family toxin [Gammaproteobacteria bacterium]|nr:type II toxin-antitoxin system PemK/MazF family toxin [Gammaproteobacteria bacterium]
MVPTDENGLQIRSQIMADKPVTIRRERTGRKIGFLGEEDVSRLNVALAFVMGLAD